ncbi:hypothetical protein [Endozoicomonas sp. YOMI1]|uniref:hypothetical protein n=1 Tax=Endozoicomonas sp. YOMI1 TaxID=2828739 RepID=UPI002148E4E8|nr:hypothetical protein [Endozoicomonas sp. YOMI1]
MPYIRLNNTSDPENEASRNAKEQAKGHFSRHRIDKFEPDSHSRSYLLGTTNTRQQDMGSITTALSPE